MALTMRWIGVPRAGAQAGRLAEFDSSDKARTPGKTSFGVYLLYRMARSRLTHFKFEYCAGVRACRGWREGER